jgi:hypothetical protein
MERNLFLGTHLKITEFFSRNKKNEWDGRNSKLT